MRPGAQIRAAIEVLDEVINRHRPAADALSDWGRSHRFAGAGDRAAIGNLVFDALRRRRSLSAQMGEETSRVLALAAAPQALGLSPADIIAMARDPSSPHSVEALSEEEQAALGRPLSEDTPVAVCGDFPDWLLPSFERAFGRAAAAEGAALARRAPIDLRVNRLKADRARVMKALSRHAPAETPLSPTGVRLAPPAGSRRAPNVEAEVAHGRGWYEVQDEGSQIAALMAGVEPRGQVLDICAGAGGKTLAFAAVMQNTGQVYAYDDEPARLRPIVERLKRAGARNVQVLPAGDSAALAALGARFDVVFIDAPCSGTGAWRRRPDAKWRLKPANVEQRRKEQRAILDRAAPLTKPGGRLVYVTCSVLPEENEDQSTWFAANHPGFRALPWRGLWEDGVGSEPPESAGRGEHGLLLTPAQHGTDGFYVAVFERAG